MARAIAREKRKEAVSTEDVLAVRLMQLVTWANRNSRAVIMGVVVLVAIGFGVWYFIDYQRTVAQRAAIELESLRASATVGSREEAVASLGTFIQRFSGTVYADEARLMLGRLSLDQQEWQAAIDALQPAAGSNLDTPTGFGATMLLAYAYEGIGNAPRAVELLSQAAAGARHGYQRHQALEEQARVLVDAGDYDGAVAAYETILADVGEGNLADRVRLRAAEARALGMAAALEPASPGVGTGDPETTGSGEPGGSGGPDAGPDASGG